MGEIITHDEALHALMLMGEKAGPSAQEAEATLLAYLIQHHHRPPAGEVRVVKSLMYNTTNDQLRSEVAPILKPGQSLAIVEPSPGVTLGREVVLHEHSRALASLSHIATLLERAIDAAAKDDEIVRLRREVDGLNAASIALAGALALERYGDPADTGFRHIADLSDPIAVKLLNEAKSALPADDGRGWEETT